MKTSEYWIGKFQLLPHPEGGYFRETYRAAGRSGDGHCFSTAIHFLLESGQFSAMHRIKSDEVWHFYDGSALDIHVIEPTGNHRVIEVGPDQPQVVVPGGHWFGARVRAPNSFALAGCTVAPGFEFADFEIGDRAKLVSQFPRHRAIIESLTHE